MGRVWGQGHSEIPGSHRSGQVWSWKRTYSLAQRLGNLSFKGSSNKNAGLCGHLVSQPRSSTIASTKPLTGVLAQQARLCVFRGTEGWISQNNTSQNTIFLLIFFQSFTNLKALLTPQMVQKQAADQAGCRLVRSSLSPATADPSFHMSGN